VNGWTPENLSHLFRNEPVQRFELGFGRRIVVGDVRTAMRFGHPEIGEQQRDRLALHRHLTLND